MSVALSVSNLSEVNSKVKAWFGAVEDAARDAVVGLAKEVLDNALINSPQYSGDYTASWRVTSKVIDYTYEKDAIPGAARWNQGSGGPEPFGRGDQQAIDFALKHNAMVWPTIKLGQTVFISSSAKHDEFYAWKIEKGQIKLRPENAGAVAIYARAARHVGHRYNFIGGSQMDWLRKVGT